MNPQLIRRLLLGLALILAARPLNPVEAAAADAYRPFEGEKSTWHDGFDRYDYLMDEETLDIQPFKRGEDEKFGLKEPPQGKRRCVVIVPRRPALGNPWSWRGCYWDHQPQAEVELLKRGFHVAYISASATLKPGKTWDAWYAFLTEKHGLSRKPAFVGMSRGGEYAYTWATANPGKVSCIYADNPGTNPDVLRKLGDLAAADVSILHVCGSIDPLLGRVSRAIETIYQQFGGRISVMIKEGAGHHPHSLRDPGPIADFISQQVQPVDVSPPPYLSGRISRSSFYGAENLYRYFPAEGNYITCRGPWFIPSFDRYSFALKGVEGSINVIVPKTIAPGKPWVFRADSVGREAAVDLALLDQGFHIVTGPVPYNGDGPSLQSWNAVYDLLTSHGFSKKPVLEGAGGAAGEAYAWAIANPDHVSCIYGENPVLRSNMTRSQPLDNLAALARAAIPVLHVCGSLDPMYASQTLEAKKRYKELGGSMTVIVQEGEGHYPTAPKDPRPVVDFIVSRQGPKGVSREPVPKEGSQAGNGRYVIDLRTKAGAAAVKGQWRYHDVRIIEVVGKNKDGSPNKTYNYEPRATGPEFDDSGWDVIEPETLKNARSTGQICFCWYRIKVTLPPEAEGKSVFFQTTVDDYGEIWVDGKLPRKPGDTGGPIVAGFNFPNRVELKDARPGKTYQVAVFGINGPISATPSNWIFLGPTFLELVDKK